MASLSRPSGSRTTANGQEDYAYVRILEEIIRRYEGKGDGLTGTQRKWLKQAKEAIVVPGKLAKSMSEFPSDPQDLYAYRERMADLIDSSGMAKVDPWGKDFGFRGFAGRWPHGNSRFCSLGSSNEEMEFDRVAASYSHRQL